MRYYTDIRTTAPELPIYSQGPLGDILRVDSLESTNTQRRIA